MPTTAPDSDNPISDLPILHVAAGVLRNAHGAVLMAQRPGDGLWELPGGKFELGETAYKALVRELREELGITVTAALPFMRIQHRYPDKQVRLHVLQVTDYQGEPQGLEGQPLAWVLPEQFNEYPCLAANVPILNAIRLDLPHSVLRRYGFWRRTGRWIALMLLLAGLIGGIGLSVFIGRHLGAWFRGTSPREVTDSIALTTIMPCDPTHTICTAYTEKLMLTLRLGDQAPLKPLVPFTVQVQLTGALSHTMAQVAVHFTMSGMDMSLWPVSLRPHASREGLWQGNAIVPVCTTQRRDWNVKVTLRSTEYFVAGPFSFVVYR